MPFRHTKMEALAYIIYSIALRTLSFGLEAPQLNLQYKKGRSLSILKTIPEPSLLYLFKTSNRYEIPGMGVLA